MNRTVLLVLALAASSAAAQQLYRWTDSAGKVHVTDSPPPAGARSVQTEKAPAPAAGAASAQSFPFELQQAMANFPVVLYTSPNCQEGCALARGALNKRGIPFKENVVSTAASIDELKKVAGAAEVPVITVGRNVQKGFEQGAYDALLDSAGYPRAGVLPPRNQTAPKPPEAAAKAEASPPPPPPEPAGPYAPKAPAKAQAEPPRVYAPIPGKDKPITGPYGKPAEEAPQAPGR